MAPEASYKPCSISSRRPTAHPTPPHACPKKNKSPLPPHPPAVWQPHISWSVWVPARSCCARLLLLPRQHQAALSCCHECTQVAVVSLHVAEPLSPLQRLQRSTTPAGAADSKRQSFVLVGDSGGGGCGSYWLATCWMRMHLSNASSAAPHLQQTAHVADFSTMPLLLRMTLKHPLLLCHQPE